MSEVEYKEIRVSWNQALPGAEARLTFDKELRRFVRHIPAVEDTVLVASIVDGKVTNIADTCYDCSLFHYCLDFRDGGTSMMGDSEAFQYLLHVKGLEKCFIGKDLDVAISEFRDVFVPDDVSCKPISEKEFKKAFIQQHKQYEQNKLWAQHDGGMDAVVAYNIANKER